MHWTVLVDGILRGGRIKSMEDIPTNHEDQPTEEERLARIPKGYPKEVEVEVEAKVKVKVLAKDGNKETCESAQHPYDTPASKSPRNQGRKERTRNVDPRILIA